MYYGDINDAIDDASDGSTVIVSSGDYTQNVNIERKEIHLKSEHGYETTTIDGNNNNAIRVHEWSHKSTVTGFTITNGFQAGILVSLSNHVAILECKMDENKYGIHFYHCEHGIVDDNTINNNKQGLILEFTGKIQIHDNVISNNSIGINLDVSKATITYNDIIDNGHGVIMSRCDGRKTSISNNNFIINDEEKLDDKILLSNHISIRHTKSKFITLSDNYYSPCDGLNINFLPWYIIIIIMAPNYDLDWLAYPNPIPVIDKNKAWEEN